MGRPTLGTDRGRVSKTKRARDLASSSRSTDWALVSNSPSRHSSLGSGFMAQPHSMDTSKTAKVTLEGMQGSGKNYAPVDGLKEGSRSKFPEVPPAWESFIKRFSKPRDGLPWYLRYRDIASERVGGKTTIGSCGLLSAHTDLATPSPATPHYTFDHSTPTFENSDKTEESSEPKKMAPTKRIKYKEASAVAPVKSDSENEHQQLQPSPAQLQPHSEIQPHPQTPLLPSATIAQATPTTVGTSASITDHSQLIDLQTAAHVATLTESASSATKALVPYSSSSASSIHHSATSIDSAVEMRGKGRGQNKPHRGDKDKEIVSKSRLSADQSTATANLWKCDETAGSLVSNASGQAWRPALAKESSNQDLNNITDTRAPGSSNKRPHRNSNANGWEVSAKSHTNDSKGNTSNQKPLKTSDNSGWSDNTDAHTYDSKGNIDSWAFPPAVNPSNQENNWAPDTTGGWATEHPPLPTQTQGHQTSRQRRSQPASFDRPINHNGRVRIEHKPKKPRESSWIKHSDIPKGDPKRHKARWSSPDPDSNSIDSDRPSSGWGTRRKRENEGAELRDWAGGMGPAMIDWDSRAQFRDHQSADKIEAWLDKTCLALKDVEPVKFANGGQDFTFTATESGNRELADEEQGDVVPRYWLCPIVDKMSADLFWATHIHKENDLQPLDEDDLNNAKPWWKYYVNGESSMLQKPKHPNITGIDPDESESDRIAREHDEGGANASANRVAAEQAKRTAHRNRVRARREKAHKFTGVRTASGTPTTPNEIKPGLKLFLRSAHKEDMIKLRDIYNRYINNAYVVPETSRLTESDMLTRWDAIRNAGLPFIVACQRGEKIKGRKQRGNTGEDMILPDKIVGFACAADWTDESSIYRPTIQLEVFVHMEQYMKRIGSCLTDKMMGLLDPNFVERGGYDTVGAELDGVVSSRVVSNIMVRYSYEEQKPDKMEWVTRWMKDRLGFEKVADLQRVAHKFDRQLNLAILQKTLEGTAPSNVPAVAAEGA